jgi:citrate synthase
MNRQHFTTAVSEVREGAVVLRGYSLEEVMRRCSYTEGAFLAIVGELPTPAQQRLVDAILTSLLDHGFVASTISAARLVASGNPQMIPAIAGGLLAAGKNTLSPEHAANEITHALRLRDGQGLTTEEAAKLKVADFLTNRKRFPGFGHPTHKTSDFRTDVIFDLADEVSLAGDAIAMIRAINHEFASQSGKHLPINIDGGLAAVGLDLGWTANQTVAFAVLSVLPGLMGHVIEEIDNGVPLRHVVGEYVGTDLRALPPFTARH